MKTSSSASTNFVSKYAKGKTTTPEQTSKAFADVQREAGVSEREISRQETTRSGISHFRSRQKAAEAAAKKVNEAAKQKAAEAAKAKAAKESARKAAELTAKRTQQELRQREQVAVESRRIESERIRISETGGSVRTQEFVKAGTTERERHTITKSDKKGSRIFEVENLETGEKTIKTFEKKGRRTRQTGGLFFKAEEVPEIKEVAIKEVNGKDFVGPKQISQTERDRLRREGQAQPVTTSLFRKVRDLPSKAVEKVTGRKPVEVFRFLTGSKEKDVTQKITLGEAVVETTQVPRRAAMITGAVLGVGATKVTEKVAPSGIKVSREKEVKMFEPQFGTVQLDPVTGKRITGEKQITVPKVTVTPKQVGKAVEVVTVAGIGIAAPIVFAPGMVTRGTQTALDKTKPTKERVFGGVEAGLGATLIGAKAVSYLRTPTITRTPLGKPISPRAVEVQKVVTVKGKPTTFSVFEIRGQTAAKVIVTKTTKIKQILGMKPKVVKVIPVKEFSVRTLEPVVGKKPFLVSEVQTGKRFATISKIGGTETKISLKEFNRLSKTEQFLLQRRAEELTGAKVALKNVPKILSKEKQRVSSFIESEKLLKIRPGKQVAEIKAITPGKRTASTLGVSEVEGIVKSDVAELSKVKTFFKDITFPGARATGKTPKLDTVILKIKPAPVADDAIRFVKPADIKKTPFSKTFTSPVKKVDKTSTILEPTVTPTGAITVQDKIRVAKTLKEVGTTSIASMVPLPKQVVQKTTTIIQSVPVSKVEKALPLIVGGIGGLKSESKFTGVMQFETTQPQVSQFKQQSLAEKQVTKQVQPQIELLKIDTTQKQVQIGKQVQKQRQGQEVKQQQLVKQLQAPKVTQITDSVLQIRQVQPQVSKPKAPSQKLVTFLPPTPKTPAKRALKQLAKEVREFEVFARIKGQDVSIGKAKTAKGAAKKLSKKLRGTLAASGFIEEDGKRLTAKETGLINGDFRVGTLDTTRIVQKKTKRLGTKQETGQIQFFRSGNGGGNMFGSSSKRGNKNDFSFL